MLFAVIPAVDGGTFKHYLEIMDKAPLNKHEKQFVKTYLQENSRNLYNIKQRSSSPFIIIDSVLTCFGLPKQLKYLAVVESELKTILEDTRRVADTTVSSELGRPYTTLLRERLVAKRKTA